MEAVLDTILSTRQVTNGIETVPLSSAIDTEEGALIQRVIAALKPETYLEVGLAYGVSALYAGEALRRIGMPYRHIILDPGQNTHWKGIGLHNIRRAGLIDNIDFYEEASEFRLPKLVEEGTKVEVAFIDGWHTFDHALIDFFYINRMLRKGGVVIFDDHHFPAIKRLVRYILKYPSYKRFDRTRPQWLSWNLKQTAARNYHLLQQGRIGLSPTGVAIQKVASDDRPWNWYRGF